MFHEHLTPKKSTGVCDEQEGLFEEAGLLREREVDMKVRLSGLPEELPSLACVTVNDIEAVVAAWTGIPVQRMTQDDRERLARMEPALKVRASLIFFAFSASLEPSSCCCRCCC